MKDALCEASRLKRDNITSSVIARNAAVTAVDRAALAG
jgi:hypothetical protein